MSDSPLKPAPRLGQRLLAWLRTTFGLLPAPASHTPLLPNSVPETSELLATAEPSPERLPSLLDPADLERLIRKKQMLQWRDSTHLAIAKKAETMKSAFVAAIDAELAKVGIWGKVFGQPSSEVLKQAYHREVRSPLFTLLRQTEAELRNVLPTWHVQMPQEQIFNKNKFDDAHDRLAQISFKPHHRQRILEEVNALFDGDGGIVDTYCQRVRDLVRLWLMEGPSC